MPVGHSMAGAVISCAAEQIPENIAQLVYLRAYLPRSDESLASLARRDTEALRDSERFIVDETDCLSIPPDVAHRAFYLDADDDTFTYALERIGPAPVRIFRDKATFTPTRFGTVPRTYIYCMTDMAIGYRLREETVARHRKILWSPYQSHSPFLTMPEALAAELSALAE